MTEQFPNRIVENFLTSAELEIIDNITNLHGSKDIVGSENNPMLHHAMVAGFFLERPQFSAIRDILIPKLQAEFGEDLELDPSTHILNAYKPYGIHSDVMTANFDMSGSKIAAWTFIIPLDDYDSHTIVFHQGFDDVKTPQEAIDQDRLQPHGLPVDPELHSRYLSHCDPNHFRYLTVESIFKWKKGWLLATDRKKFHTSDNFPIRGLSCKRAIVMWSNVPKSF